MMFKSALAAMVLAISSTLASAATYNVSGSFSDGNLGTVVFDVDVAGDFSTSFNSSPISGAAITTLTADGSQLLLPSLTASYSVSVDVLSLTYLNAPDPTDGTDFNFFEIKIGAFKSTAAFVSVFDATGSGSQIGCYVSPGLNTFACDDQAPLISVGALSVTLLPDGPGTPAVPLPASALLLSGGLLGFGVLGRRRRRTV